ncbi:glycoside hydrolase family 35 protein [Rhodocollybia butyracea]|uniref:Beta-galactosidase n=1 Tax=Rhodocollybia butyracea TaxID=206335 RepID=A0A9P5Q8A6_9AGAR|nr:glycoside hydrolase family 35 protein [Rhodocollybia butyracea]
MRPDAPTHAMHLLSFFLQLYILLVATQVAHSQSTLSSNGLTTAVEWDEYSFFILGNRTFIQSGEFHMWRLPVPSLWRDIVQKAKAAGLNTLSVYFHWGLINPRPGEVDLTGINDYQPFFDAAKEEGLWVIARPGPYINSETSTGGIPGHVAWIPGNPPWNPYNGELRSNDTFYHSAWQDYWTGVISLISKNQVTNGGPVILLQIENEYYNGPGQNQYIDQLRQRAVQLGVVIPTFVNDAGEFNNLVNDTDLYGFDAYPLSASNCGNANPAVWPAIPTTWRSYFDATVPGKPHFFPEFQGGSADNWGSAGGYANCRELVGINFQRVFYHQMWADGVTAENYYMFYGGTTWAQLPYSQGYTSYDYGAPVDEQRQITAKHGELKLQSLFLRSFPDFYMTDLIKTDTTTVPNVFITQLKNPLSGSSFYIFRPNSVATTNTTLNFQYNIGQANTLVPQNGGNLTLLGRDSFVIVTDLLFGTTKLQYSTASLLTWLDLGGSDLLVVYGYAEMPYEMAFELSGTVTQTVTGPTQVSGKAMNGTYILNFSLSSGVTLVHLATSNEQITVLIADSNAATQLWQPTVAGSGNFANYVGKSASTPLIVSGPYLVRNASLEGQNLALWGDVPETTNVEIFGPKVLASLTWNTIPVRTLTQTGSSTWQAVIPFSMPSISLPDLESATWRFRDSLPEIQPHFNKFASVPANQTTTVSVFPPYYGEPWILYADQYGFHAGNLVWRGTFVHNSSTTTPTAINISSSGAVNFAASVWLNTNYLGASDTRSRTNNDSFVISDDLLVTGENTVVVLQDHMGGDLSGQDVCCTPGGRARDLQQPRGLQGYYLVGRDASSQFTGWTLAGNFMGENNPDTVRKIYNEGGLYGERAGWHLPGYNDSLWEERTPFQGIGKPGVGFFRTTFNLDLPEGYDIPLSFVFDSAVGHYRSQLYVNGWQMGKRIANIGPQTAFPVHEGILNYHGTNTVVLSLWALGNGTADTAIPSFKLVANGTVSGGVGGITTNNPDWRELRGNSGVPL